MLHSYHVFLVVGKVKFWSLSKFDDYNIISLSMFICFLCLFVFKKWAFSLYRKLKDLFFGVFWLLGLWMMGLQIETKITTLWLSLWIFF